MISTRDAGAVGRLVSFTALPLAALLAVACGGSIAPAPTQTTNDAGGVDAPVDQPDASVPDAADPINPVYPAPHTPMPLVDNNGGRVLQSTHIVTITWSNDDPNLVSRLQLLDDTITTTPWWKAVGSEYCEKGGAPCIGPGTPGEHVIIKDPPPVSGFSDTTQGNGTNTMQDFIKAQLANNPDFPDPTNDTIYAFYLPPGTDITLDGTQGCANGGFGAYHSTVDLQPKKGPNLITTSYAIIPRCGSKEGTTTVSASHEFIEAATDPDVGEGNLTYYMQNQTWAFAGGEVGDLCVDFTGNNDKVQESSFLVQRSWSNESAKASHDPCVPILPGEVYFNAAPRKQKLVLKKVGDTAVLDIDTYSDAPMPNWNLTAFDYAQFQQNTTYVGFSFDKPSVNNGTHVQLTVTLKRAIPQYTMFGIISTNSSGTRHVWPVLVTP